VRRFLCIIFLILACHKNHPPNIPSDPYPPDGAKDQPTLVPLSWKGGDPDGDSVLYSVYFGTTPEPPRVHKDTATSYTASNLLPATTYYWRIEAVDEKGDTSEGPLWKFSTCSKGPGILKWKLKLEGKITSPAISSDGTIYLGSGFSLYAITPEGEVKWKYPTGYYIESSPAIAEDGTVYIGSSDSCLYAITKDGNLKWRYKTANHIISSPAIGKDGTIYVGSDDSCLYAINPDGTLKWRYKLGERIRSSPAIGKDGTVYLGCNDSCFYAINPDSTLKWKYKTEGGIVSSPAISEDGIIYVGSKDGYLYAFYPDGRFKWKYGTGGEINSSPVIGMEGEIYVGGDVCLYAISSDGTRRWRYTTRWYIETAPVIGSDGVVYIGSGCLGDFSIYAIDRNMSLRWVFKIDKSPSSGMLGSDGTLYIGSEGGYLYAIETSSSGLAESSWPVFHHDRRHTGRAGG